MRSLVLRLAKGSRRQLEGWVDVELLKEVGRTATSLQFPRNSVYLKGAPLPRWVWVRRADDDGEGPTSIRRAVTGDGKPEIAVKCSGDLIVELDIDEDAAVYPPAQVKRATRRDRLVHDRSYQVTSALLAAGLAGAAFGIVDAVVGSLWSKVVVAAIALAVFVIQQIASA